MFRLIWHGSLALADPQVTPGELEVDTLAVREVAAQLGVAAGSLAATAGEDYELCACVPPGARASVENAAADWHGDVQLTWIGRVLDGPIGVIFGDEPGGLSGYEHRL